MIEIQTSFKTIEKRRENYSTKQRTVRTSKQVKRNLKVASNRTQPYIMGGNKDKNKDHDSGNCEDTMGDSITSPWDARHTNRDLSQEREARDTALAKQVMEAIVREMAKAHTHYQALLNERGTAAMPTSLKVTSEASGFKVMDPFDWTKDNAIYRRWQMWSEKARHTLDAMEGDTEKTKISYFHH